MENVREIMRLAGAGEDAEGFEVALAGTARPGYRAPDRTPRTERAGLLERRGYEAARVRYSPTSDRLYFRVCVATDALGEVCAVVGDLWKALERVQYGDDPEKGYGEAAGKILEGPLADVEKLTKAAGFALDKYFAERGERDGGPFGLKKLSLGTNDLDASGLKLRGEVAEALAVLKVVAPQIEKAGARDCPEIDLDLWKKAGPAFVKGVEARVDVLCAALDKLGASLVAARYGGGVGYESEAKAAAEHRALERGADALAEELAAPADAPWEFGMGELDTPLLEASTGTYTLRTSGGSHWFNGTDAMLKAMQAALPTFFGDATRSAKRGLGTPRVAAREAGKTWLAAQGYTPAPAVKPGAPSVTLAPAPKPPTKAAAAAAAAPKPGTMPAGPVTAPVAKTAPLTTAAVEAFVRTLKTWFEVESTTGHRVSFATRDHGDVAEGTPGHADGAEAKRVLGALVKHFGDGVTVKLDVVDEWVTVDVTVKPGAKAPAEARGGARPVTG